MSKLDDVLKGAKSSDNPADFDSDLKSASDLAKQALAQQSATEEQKAKVTERLNKVTPTAEALAGNTIKESMRAGFASQQPSDSFHPDIQISPPQTSAEQNTAREARNVARPATSIDLSKITEADVMNLDFISAKSFDIPAMLQVEPKDPSIRFRWVNYKNYEGGNYAMFKAIGFENAKPEDIKGEYSEHLKKEDGTIKWFDVILMKVNVLHIMGVYKKNIISALKQVGRWQPQAIAQAKRTLENEVGSDILNQLKKQGLQVEFYAPSQQEMASQDKEFADGQ